MSYFRSSMKLAAAAALAAALGVAGTSAHAALTLNALTFNSLTFNALEATGSALGDLNGLAVEAVTVAPGVPVAFEPQPIPPGQEDW